MTVPAKGSQPAQEMVTQESLLLSTAERIGRIREGRIAVHIHLSKLRPHNRQDSQLRIALRMFDPLVHAYRGQIFLLSNSDIVLLAKDARTTDVDLTVYRLRALFSKDPLTFNDTGDGRDQFYTWHDLDCDYDDFLALARRMNDEAQKLQRAKPAGPVKREIDPRGLAKALEQLTTIDMARMVRRQAAVHLTERNTAEVVFQEFFVAMAELERAISPGAHLSGNRWLFQHLSQTLDQRMLAVLQDLSLRSLPQTFSVNLNVATVFSPAFRTFEEWLARDGRRLMVEVQVIDVFADLGAYFYARDWLHERGHKMVLDGLTSVTLHFMDIAQYKADIFKLSWSPELALEASSANDILGAFDKVGVEDHALLMRCDSEAAIHWGMELGVKTFQGRYVDAMLAAMTMSACDHAAACTLAQCIGRRSVVTGRHRTDCGNNDMLDGFPILRAPKRRAPAGVA